MGRTWRRICAVLVMVTGAAALSACGPSYENGPPEPTSSEIAALEQAILSLGADVDPEEAAATARTAYLYPLQLAESYQITDPPIIHNMKVNSGTRPRGLCYQWADDLEARLETLDTRGLELHRAIANADQALRIEHSTVIVTRAGAPWTSGIILDPWRWGGRLFWSPVTEDPDYDWAARGDVFAFKRARETGARPVLSTY
ncbi:hypothetical protein [Roseivivax marinus]|uniref:hypothetical protein n=1 Tax=Roseivivax marinus TaxID=1379903 RepID=UPI0005C1A346|nr:hypothetical protein [Roseivivax marinus]